MRNCVLFTGLIIFSIACMAQEPGNARIAAARKSVQTHPESVQGYLDLAAALCRQGGDTGDPVAYTEAAASIARALELSPGNYDALKLRVVTLLGLHDFGEALKQAKALNRKTPDDIAVWGYLVDANTGIGEYAEAEKDAQWILDLRRGSTLGFVKAAGLREIFGDLEGAIEFYDEALLRTSANDVEERAWLMTQNSRLQLASGNARRAGELLEKASALNPGSQSTTAQLANFKASQGNYAEAISLRKQLLEKTPSAVNLYTLAVMLEKNGQAEEAHKVFREFEGKARTDVNKTFNANRQLVDYDLEHGGSAAEALEIAAKEMESRHDVETLDAYAWALYRNGKIVEAQTQMDRALGPGVRDAGFFCHALQIATATQNPASVKRFSKELSDKPASACPISPGVK